MQVYTDLCRGRRAWTVALPPAVLAFLLAVGCAPATRLSPPAGLGSRMVRDVPYYAQEAHQCGPATLAMVLNYLGDPVTVDKIADEVFRSELRGAVSLDMALYARSRGYKVRFGSGTPDDLIRSMDRGVPVIVMVNEGFSRIRSMHYMVVVGYTPEAVIVHSGPDRALAVPWSRFLGRWQGADTWMLRIEPQPATE